MEDIKIEKRKEKILRWLKDPYNLTFLLVLVSTIAIRLYYFVSTYGQPLWWDESEYVSTAKKWAFGSPYDISIQRQPLFPILMTGLFKLGFNLDFIKLFLVLVPYFLTIIALYYFAKTLYDKKIALIATFLFAVSWNISFWTYRFSTDILGLLFAVLCLLFFVKAEKVDYKRSLIFYALSGAFLSLGILTRLPNVFLIAMIGPYILIKAKDFILSKKIIYFLIPVILLMLPYLYYNFSVSGDPFTFFQTYFGGDVAGEKLSKPVAWGVFSLIPLYFGWMPYLLVFFLGLLTFYTVLIGFDLIPKKDNLRYDVLILLIFIAPFLILAFGERRYEERWAYLALPAITIIFARGIVLIENFFKKYIKGRIILYLIIIFLLFGAYANIKMLDSTLISKKDSFSQLRDAGIYLKNIAPADSLIFSNSHPQISAYSERLTLPMPMTEEDYYNNLSDGEVDYVVASIFENNFREINIWTDNFVKNNTNSVEIVQVFSGLINNQEAPMVVVYKINH